MNLFIGREYYRTRYFVKYNSHIDSNNLNVVIAEYLGMSVRKLNKIIRSNNGVIIYTTHYKKARYQSHRFDNIDDCQKFLDELTPYIVMKKLTQQD
jgi:uncharacterized protein YvpB